MKTPYYESHITLVAPDSLADRIRTMVEAAGWKFSKIDGDPVLGDGVKMYATHNYPTDVGIAYVTAALHGTSIGLIGCGYRVIRRKIETVVFDQIEEN